MAEVSGSAGQLEFDRLGEGEPLLLVHGTGSSRAVWAPVRDALAAERDVIAVDLPGHGASPLPRAGIEPTPVGYARVLGEFLDDLGLDTVDVAGNSVGGWTAFELAKAGRARSVVALAPAGLWHGRSPRSSYWQLKGMRRMSPLLVRAGPALFRTAAMRTVLLGGTFGRPWRMPPDEAFGALRGMAETRGFHEHLDQTNSTRFTGGAHIDVPVTVAFGKRERLIPRGGRHRDELPAHTDWITLPGCGHVPMWDDPVLITRTILHGTRTRDNSGT